jgi:predicted transposase YdaD
MDHDPLFKELLRTFFVEFIELFLPDVAVYLDASTIEFLDREVFTDLGGGERHEVDLVVKARFQGRDAFFLIHVETQSWPQAAFPERMFDYFALLHLKFRLPIYPIALFSYDAPLRPEHNKFTVDFPDLQPLRFEFRAIQLNRLDWREFIRRPNPVAAALMTKMKIAPEDRPRVKLECLRMIATLKLDKARAALVGMFMESYLKLTTEENAVYNRELRAIASQEQEAVMQYTNPWIEEGKAKGRQDLILRLLARRFGEVPAELAERIATLPDSRMEAFAESLLDFQSLADAQAWIACHA